MYWKIAQLKPVSAFGSTLRGDMIFGQLCWAIRNRFGAARLDDLLGGYSEGRPFAVVSDAFPTGYLPKPALPLAFSRSTEEPEKRKEAKSRKWVAFQHFSNSLDKAFDAAVDVDIFKAVHQSHNNINRTSNTTGNGFDPYQTERQWPNGDVIFDLHVLLDETRITPGDLHMALSDIGRMGFGRDSSTGLGRFDLSDFEDFTRPTSKAPNALLTLAPSAPQGLKWDAGKCFYLPFVRFGRHGDVAALGGAPFKSPVIMADTGAVLTPRDGSCVNMYTGQGLGGDGSISKEMPETVHQGYAPVIPAHLPVKEHVQ